MRYRELLFSSARRSGSLFCLGIDPVVEWFPRELRGDGIKTADGIEPSAVGRVVDLLEVALSAFDSIGAPPAAFKPNIGYFVRYDRPRAGEFAGSRALASILEILRDRAPETPIILDAKRGDIARSSANYAAEAFDVWGVDAVTVSPWMGDDSVEPFLARAAEYGGIYLLARTSNPGARRFQNLILPEGDPVYRRVLDAAITWDRGSTAVGAAGVVLGATAPAELRDALTRLLTDPVPVLIPGVGGQGGSAEEVLRIVVETDYPPELVRVNASSGALFPWARRNAGGNTGAEGGENADAGRADWRQEIARSVTALHRSLAFKPAAAGGNEGIAE